MMGYSYRSCSGNGWITLRNMVRLLDISVSFISCFERPVFGIPLSVAVVRNKCHDEIQLPVMFRECVDYIEEPGKITRHSCVFY